MSEDAAFAFVVTAFCGLVALVASGALGAVWNAIRDALRGLRWRPKSRTERDLARWVEWAGAQRTALETKRATNREAAALWLAEYLEVAHSGGEVLGMRYFPSSIYNDDGKAARALLDGPVRERVERRPSGGHSEPEVRYLRNGEVVVVQPMERYEYVDGMRVPHYERKEIARWRR